MMEMSPEQAIATRDGYLMQLKNEHMSFLSVVKSMPDDKLGYKPCDDIMDFATQARHIAQSGKFFTDLVQNGEVAMDEPTPPTPPPATAAELAAEIEPMLKDTVAKFQGFTGEQLAKPLDFFGMGPMPGVVYLNWDMVHLIHHRAQMALYLRIAGAKVPAIYGPSRDVSFEEMMENKCSDA